MVWPVCEDQLMYGSSMVLPQRVQVVLFWGERSGAGQAARSVYHGVC